MQCDMYTNVPIVEYGCDTRSALMKKYSKIKKNKGVPKEKRI